MAPATAVIASPTPVAISKPLSATASTRMATAAGPPATARAASSSLNRRKAGTSRETIIETNGPNALTSAPTPISTGPKAAATPPRTMMVVCIVGESRVNASSAPAILSINGVMTGSSFVPIATCSSSNAAFAARILFAVPPDVRSTSPCAFVVASRIS